MNDESVMAFNPYYMDPNAPMFDDETFLAESDAEWDDAEDEWSEQDDEWANDDEWDDEDQMDGDTDDAVTIVDELDND